MPVGETTVPITISARAQAVRLSLRTSDASEAKIRQAVVTAYVENVWRALRQNQPASLSPQQAQALAGELYRAWADEDRTRWRAVENVGGEFRRVEVSPEERQAYWETIEEKWITLIEREDEGAIEKEIGPLIDRILRGHGIACVDTESRRELRWAFSRALRHAFASRRRNADGDYSPDPIADRFPRLMIPLSPPSQQERSAQKESLGALVEDWWREAKAIGRSISTYDSYRNTMARLVLFLGHDDATQVTPEDILRFKEPPC